MDSRGVFIHTYHRNGLMRYFRTKSVDDLFLDLDDWVESKKQEGYPYQVVVESLENYVRISHDLDEATPVDIFRPKENYDP